MSKMPLSPLDEFASIMTDPDVFEEAVSSGRLYELIPGLKAFDVDLPEKDPNIYRPMPLMQHTFEAIRQAFTWIGSFGAEEYRSDEAKRNAARWVNTSLLFHDLGETALIKGTNLPIWYNLATKWIEDQDRIALILRETYPFFEKDTPEARNYIGHLLHPEISAVLANQFLSRLGIPLREIKIVDFLIRNQSILIEKATYGRTKDGRTFHGDFYEDIESVERETGIPKDDLLKMLQALQLADANAVRPGMARIPQVTLMRVWMAYDYMMLVLTVRSSPARYEAFMRYRDMFNRIRRARPFGTTFEDLFRELLERIEKEEGPLAEDERKILEQHLEYYEKFRIIKEDHIYINDQFNQLLGLMETESGAKLSGKDKALLLTAYKVAYRSHDGDSRRQLKTVPVGDVRRKFIEHPIRVARIMVEVFHVVDPVVIATLLLHDVLEDTDTSSEDIKAAFKRYDGKGRILKALEILTRPGEEESKNLSPLLQEIEYLCYVAGTITATGNKILEDRELLDWLRINVPLSKASDKIQNRRTLMGRKPKGRIEEICRNANTLVMFMESSSLNPEQKLKILDEFNRSLLEIFNLFDLQRHENQEKFLHLLKIFLQETMPRLAEAHLLSLDARQKLDAFTQAGYKMFADNLGDPVKDIRVDLLLFEKRMLPAIIRELGLSEDKTAAVMDAFNMFLFEVSEVEWLREKQNILKFQSIIRFYRDRMARDNGSPVLPAIIEELARYSLADKGVKAPIIRSSKAMSAADVILRIPFFSRLYDSWMRWNQKRREFVLHLLPRIAMLPLKHVYWFEDNAVNCVRRECVEDHIGGVAVSRSKDGRLILSIHQGLRGIK